MTTCNADGAVVMRCAVIVNVQSGRRNGGEHKDDAYECKAFQHDQTRRDLIQYSFFLVNSFFIEGLTGYSEAYAMVKRIHSSRNGVFFTVFFSTQRSFSSPTISTNPKKRPNLANDLRA